MYSRHCGQLDVLSLHALAVKRTFRMRLLCKLAVEVLLQHAYAVAEGFDKCQGCVYKENASKQYTKPVKTGSQSTDAVSKAVAA